MIVTLDATALLRSIGHHTIEQPFRAHHHSQISRGIQGRPYIDAVEEEDRFQLCKYARLTTTMYRYNTPIVRRCSTVELYAETERRQINSKETASTVARVLVMPGL